MLSVKEKNGYNPVNFRGFKESGFEKKTGVSNTRPNHENAINNGWSSGIDYYRCQLLSFPKRGLRVLDEFLNGGVPSVWSSRQTGWVAPGFSDRYSTRIMFTSGGYLLVRSAETDQTENKVECVYESIEELPELVDVWVELTGNFWAGMDSMTQLGVMHFLSIKNKARVMRLDIKVDMHSDIIHIADLDNAIEQRNYARVKGGKKIIPFSINPRKKIGITYYFGSRESDKMVRYYDAKVKHGIDAMRWECEFKKDRCRIVNDKLMELSNEASDMLKESLWKETEVTKADILKYVEETLTRYALGAVEFIDREKMGKNGNIDNRYRLKWWQEKIDKVGELIAVKVERVKVKIERSIEYFRRVKKTFARINKAVGVIAFNTFIRNITTEGIDKLDDYDKQAIKEYHSHGNDSYMGLDDCIGASG